MPLEIRELHIKVTVNQPQQNSGASQASESPGNAKMNDDDKEALINQCIDEVMEIMNAKKER